MSDLYHETTEQETRPDPARETDAAQHYETAETYTESQDEAEARIADQDELPTPAESRQATWGDNPDYSNDADFGSEYDGDDAFLAEHDELPPPQESRERTWGDNPDYDDLTSEHDGAPGPIDSGENTLDDDSTTNAAADYTTPEQPSLIAQADELPTDTGSDSGNPGSNDHDLAESKELDRSGHDLAAAVDDKGPDGPATSTHVEDEDATDAGGHAAADRADNPSDSGTAENEHGAREEGTDATDQPEHTETDPEHIRLLEAGREIADLKASNAELTARVDQMEQLLARLAQQPDGDSDTHERHGDKSDTVMDQDRGQDATGTKYDTSIGDREASDAGMDNRDSEPAGWRRIPSAENLELASIVGSTAEAAAQVAAHVSPDGLIGLGLATVGLAAVLKGRAEKRKGKK